MVIWKKFLKNIHVFRFINFHLISSKKLHLVFATYYSFLSFDLNEPGHREYILGYMSKFISELKSRTDNHPVHDDVNFLHKQMLLKLFKRIKVNICNSFNFL